MITHVDGLPFVQVPGTTETVGRGRLFSYVALVEEGIGGRREFARRVDAILANPRGWIRGGKVAFRRVVDHPDTFVILARPDTVDLLCTPLDTQGEVSCCVGPKVVINLRRWREAVPHWDGSLGSYRTMVVNHEWGHRIGKGHGQCPGSGKKAPVMQQQTYGLQGCQRNSWPLESEL